MFLAGWFVYICLHWLGGGATGLRILLICDQTFHEACRQKQNDPNDDVVMRFVPVSDIHSYVTHVRIFDALLRNGTSYDVMLVFGHSEIVSAVGTVVQEFGLPVIAYTSNPDPVVRPAQNRPIAQ